MILFVLFVMTIESNDLMKINAAELAFMIYASGFTLEKIAAMQERGIRGACESYPSFERRLIPNPVFFKGTWVRISFMVVPALIDFAERF